MFAVDICVMLEKCVGDSHKKMLGRFDDEELKGLFTLFWNWKGAVETCEITAVFYDSSPFDFIVFDVRGEWVNDKLESLAISLSFLEKLRKPFIMRSQ